MNTPLKTFVANAVLKHLTMIKFLIVGVWNTVFGYLVYYLSLKLILTLFTTTQLAYVWAMGIAQVIGTINAYFSHRGITFAERASEKKGQEFLKFSLIYVLTFCLTLVLMPLFVRGLGISAEIAGIIVILIGTAVSYIGHSRFSFQPK
ncbi:MAG: GtrA family protein [Burkholderiaceae bacterium]